MTFNVSQRSSQKVEKLRTNWVKSHQGQGRPCSGKMRSTLVGMITGINTWGEVFTDGNYVNVSNIAQWIISELTEIMDVVMYVNKAGKWQVTKLSGPVLYA